MMEMYIIWAFNAVNRKYYKFIRAVNTDDLSAQLDKFENDVRKCIGSGCYIEMIIRQDNITFEGTTTEYEWRHKNDN